MTLLNALTCVEGLPPASAAISGGGIATNVPGTEAIQGDGMVSKLLRLLMLSLVLTLLIFAACFARWGPIPNRFSASKGSEDEVDAKSCMRNLQRPIFNFHGNGCCPFSSSGVFPSSHLFERYRPPHDTVLKKRYRVAQRTKAQQGHVN